MPGTVKSGLLPDVDRSHKCDSQEKRKHSLLKLIQKLSYGHVQTIYWFHQVMQNEWLSLLKTTLFRIASLCIRKADTAAALASAPLQRDGLMKCCDLCSLNKQVYMIDLNPMQTFCSKNTGFSFSIRDGSLVLQPALEALI